MVNAQKWLNKAYLSQKRSEKAELDISKGKVKKWGYERTLKGDLKLLEFTNLKKLVINEHQLTSLDVSDCKNLEELYCHSNQLNDLIVKGCANLKKINCSKNNLKNLDLASCPNLEEIELSDCSKELIENGQAIKFHPESNLFFTIKKDKLIKGPNIIPAENSTRNILIVGWTGGGKSTLANILTSTNNFGESNYGVSKTDNYQTTNFEWQAKEYQIIDNIGFGDTRSNLSEEDVIKRIGDGIISAKEGINQILFVIRGRFSQEHIKTFKLFEKAISETGITKFTTLIITGFESFRNKEKVKKDKEALVRENKELREIIEACNGIIHINNPSINIPPADDEDEEEKEDRERKINSNKKRREESAKIVLDHLIKSCSEIYKLREWDDLYSSALNYKEAENNLNNSRDKREKVELEKAKKSWFKQLRIKMEASVPGLPISANVEVDVTRY